MNNFVSVRKKRLINDIAIKNEFKNYSVTFNKCSIKGEGYIGSFTFVDIKESSSEKSLYLVLKSGQVEPEVRQRVSIENTFGREIFMYEAIFKDFSELQKEFLIEEKFDGTPKFYGGLTDLNEECLVLENLRKSGFSLWNRKKPMDSHHVEAVIAQYGRFHALSYALKKLKPEIYAERTKNLSDVMKGKLLPKHLDKAFDYFMHKAFEAVGEKSKAIEGLRRYTSGLQEFFLQCKDVKDKFAVIMHGDCWCNNMMFQYDENEPKKPSKVYLIDWQMCTVGSPLMDIAYFFFTCSSEECLNDHVKYLRMYHQSLLKMLSQFHLKVDDIMTFEELLAQWKIYAKYGLFLALLAIKVMLTNEDEVREIKDLEKDEYLFDIFQGDISNSEEYDNRIRIVIDNMIKNCYI